MLWHAEHIEEGALAFERRLRGQDQRLDGTLRLSCVWRAYAAPVIAEFAIAQPNVVVELLTDARLAACRGAKRTWFSASSRFDEPEVIARRLVHISYGIYLNNRPGAAGLGNGAAIPDLITMDHRLRRHARCRVAVARVAEGTNCRAQQQPRGSGAPVCAGQGCHRAAASAWRCDSRNRGSTRQIRPAAPPVPGTAISNVWPGCTPGARHREDRAMRLLPATPARAKVLNRRHTIAQAAAQSSRCRRIRRASARR